MLKQKDDESEPDTRTQVNYEQDQDLLNPEIQLRAF